jgi:hypothetical protein
MKHFSTSALFIDVGQHLFPEVHVSLQAMTGDVLGSCGSQRQSIQAEGNRFRRKTGGGGAKLSENSGV